MPVTAPVVVMLKASVPLLKARIPLLSPTIGELLVSVNVISVSAAAFIKAIALPAAVVIPKPAAVVTVRAPPGAEVGAWVTSAPAGPEQVQMPEPAPPVSIQVPACAPVIVRPMPVVAVAAMAMAKAPGEIDEDNL